MIREQVVVTSIRITKSGQVKHFQVKLPKNTTRIIGIELGGRWLAQSKDGGTLPHATEAVFTELVKYEQVAIKAESRSPLFKKNLLVGEIKLQSCEEANIFYAADVQGDSNLAYGDFTQNAFWKPSTFTHQAHSFEEKIIVDGNSTIIQGVYKDRYGDQTKQVPNYIVNLYVWTERQEPEKQK